MCIYIYIYIHTHIWAEVGNCVITQSAPPRLASRMGPRCLIMLYCCNIVMLIVLLLLLSLVLLLYYILDYIDPIPRSCRMLGDWQLSCDVMTFVAVFLSGDCFLFDVCSFRYNYPMRKTVDNNHITWSIQLSDEPFFRRCCFHPCVCRILPSFG